MKNAVLSFFIAIGASLMTLNATEVKTSVNKVRVSETSEIILPDGAKVMHKGQGDVRHIVPMSKNKAEAQKVTVTLSVTSNSAKPSGAAIYNKDVFEQVWFDGREASVEVPVGTYDVFVNFYSGTSYYVFKENVSITAGMDPLVFDQADAVNSVELNFFDENKKELFMDIYDGNRLETPGTADSMSKIIAFYHKEYGNAAMILSRGYMPKRFPMDFMVNKLSDKYLVVVGTLIEVKEKCYVFKNAITNFESQVINSDPENLQKCLTTYTVSPMMKDQVDAHVPGVDFSILVNGIFIGGQRSWYSNDTDEKDEVATFIDCPESDENSVDKCNVIVSPMLSDTYEVISDEFGTRKEFYFVRGTSMIGNAKEGVKFIVSGMDMDWGGFNVPEGMIDNKYYPGHPEFSFISKDGSAHFGNSVPLCSYRAIKYLDYGSIAGWDSFRYIGRYGEEYEAHSPIADIAYDNVPEGERALITNNNVTVDGMPGKNITEVVYDNKKSDFTAPTFQIMSFKNAEGVLTDRLQTMQGSKMIFAGGDFTYHDMPVSPYIGHFTCSDPASVKAFYAPHGTEEWTELTVTEDKSKFFMPAYGNFYEADLSGISVSGENVWYDVRLEMTDPAGNYQKQTISPAFQANSTNSSVEGIVDAQQDELVLVGKVVKLVADSSADFAVYSIDGRLLLTASGSQANLAELNAGIYVVTAKTSDGSIISRKFAL